MDAGIVSLGNDAADFSDENDSHLVIGIEKDLVVIGKPVRLGRLLRMNDSLQCICQPLGAHGF